MWPQTKTKQTLVLESGLDFPSHSLYYQIRLDNAPITVFNLICLINELWTLDGWMDGSYMLGIFFLLFNYIFKCHYVNKYFYMNKLIVMNEIWMNVTIMNGRIKNSNQSQYIAHLHFIVIFLVIRSKSFLTIDRIFLFIVILLFYLIFMTLHSLAHKNIFSLFMKILILKLILFFYLKNHFIYESNYGMNIFVCIRFYFNLLKI